MHNNFNNTLHPTSIGYAVSVALICLLFFALPLVYWPTLFEAASLPRFFLISLVGSLTLVLWSTTRGDRSVNWHPGFSLILVFFGWAAVSTSWSQDPGTSLIDITQLFSMLVVGFLAMQLSASPTFLKYLLLAILIGAALTAIIGIGQFFGINPFEFRKELNSIPATFINPNHAAVYFDFIPPLSFVAIFTYQRLTMRLLAATTLGLSLAYLQTSASRGSVLALFVVVLALMIVVIFKPEIRNQLKLGLRLRYKEIILAMLIPLIVFFPLGEENIGAKRSVSSKLETTLLEGKIDKATTHRFAMYLNSLPAIIDSPMTGLGYGGVRVGFQPYTSSLLPTTLRTQDTVLRELHSDPLQYFVELGLPGGLLSLAIFFLLLRTGWKAFSLSTVKSQSLIVLGFWLGIIACGTHALVDFPLRLPTSAAMFWLSAGILLGMETTPHIRLTGKSLRPLISLIGVTGVIFTIFFYNNYLSANHNLYNSLVNLQKGKCVAAAQAAEDGLETFVSDFMLLTAYAQIYSVCNFPPSQQMATMNRVLNLDPSNLRARITRANLYNKANQPEMAIPEFEKVTHVLPHSPYAYAGLGDSARLEGDNSRARYYYRAALKRKPDYKYVIRQLAKLEEGGEN